MTSGSSELLLDPLQELRKKKLTELANIRKKADQKSRREQAWFYATLLFAMATVTTGTSLLFLVPLYVDPAISTLIADFVPEPVTCTTTRRDDYSGLFNCSWSSCREGCTSDFYRCTHIYVEYAESMSDVVDTDQSDASTHHEAVLLVNIKGCGYPPNVRCSNFTAKYGVLGASFPCYYSRQNKTVAMNRYDRTEQVRTIVNFCLIPFAICIVSSVTLCVMHCDCRVIPKPDSDKQNTEEPNRFVQFFKLLPHAPTSAFLHVNLYQSPAVTRDFPSSPSSVPSSFILALYYRAHFSLDNTAYRWHFVYYLISPRKIVPQDVI